MNASLFPLRSELRTPEQMEWIHDRFKLDGLERLARSEKDYYDSHGHYLPDVAALAHAAIQEAERLNKALDGAYRELRRVEDLRASAERWKLLWRRAARAWRSSWHYSMLLGRRSSDAS